MIIMQIEVKICDNTDPHANRIVDGVYWATSDKLRYLRTHERVKITRAPSPAITLSKDDVKLIEERIITNE